MKKYKTVCAIIINETGLVLLTKRAREPFKGKWAIPSGIGESKKGIAPEIGVIEEVRCDLGTSSFKGEYAFSIPITNDKITDEAVVFVGKVNEDEIKPVPKYSAGYRWTSEPEKDLAFEHSGILKKYFEHHLKGHQQ